METYRPILVVAALVLLAQLLGAAMFGAQFGPAEREGAPPGLASAGP